MGARREGRGGKEKEGRGAEGKGKGGEGMWRGPESGLPRGPRWLSAGLMGGYSEVHGCDSSKT